MHEARARIRLQPKMRLPSPCWQTKCVPCTIGETATDEEQARLQVEVETRSRIESGRGAGSCLTARSLWSAGEKVVSGETTNMRRARAWSAGQGFWPSLLTDEGINNTQAILSLRARLS